MFSLLLVFIFTKNQNDLSVCAALITISDTWCHFIVIFFPAELEYMKQLLYCWWCAALFVVLSGICNDMCVLCRLI